MTLQDKCVLASQCKAAGTDKCNVFCYPYTQAHGNSGVGGFWGATNVPRKYRGRFAKNLNLIQQQNPQAYQILSVYAENVLDYVAEGVGLFLYSIPNPENPMGTGTGKTTAATTLVNEYTIQRVIQHVSGKKRLDQQPAVFIRASEFQNTFNAQFRGTEEARMEASEKYYDMKNLMMTVELLVLDDISLRNSTESLTNELYEILDERNIEGLATVLTSNLPLQKVGEMLSPQIASRIAGMTESVGFVGKDNRKGWV